MKNQYTEKFQKKYCNRLYVTKEVHSLMKALQKKFSEEGNGFQNMNEVIERLIREYSECHKEECAINGIEKKTNDVA